jgi:tRNA_anti-like
MIFMKKKKLALLLIMLLVLAGAFYGWREYHRGHVSTSAISPIAVKQAAQLVKEFENDEAVANLAYNDKVISVSGKIVKTNLNDSTSNLLLAGESSMAGVLCQFENAYSKQIEKMKTGDFVQVKGVCTGVLMDVILTRCVLDQ